MFPFRARGLLIGAVLTWAMLLTACGSQDKCADVSCEFGVCDSATGQCSNPKSCADTSECALGYECSDGACVASAACSADADCATGVCTDGACTNPKSCTSNEQCVARTYCGPDGTCVADPCNDYTCDRGQCVRGTQTCESKDSCTDATEAQDCIDGEKCLDGACMAKDDFCAALNCARGVCDFDQKTCVSATDCGGDDSKCVDGEFCNSMNQCAEDLCVTNHVDCASSGGVCLPSVGQCQDATACTANDQCLDGHLCVIADGESTGTCTPKDAACGDGPGDGGCYGNQVCTQDSSTLQTSCTESGSCTTSLDCTGDRQCGGSTCMAPAACQNDRMEPNDTDTEATSFADVALANGLDAFVCSGDTDYYAIDTRKLTADATRGTLRVTVDYAPRDVGLGGVDVELFAPDGTSVDTATSGTLGIDGQAEVDATLTLANQGVYLVRITDAGDVSTAGVSYRLAATLLPADSADACTNATTISAQQTLQGDTRTASSYAMGSTCTSLSNNAHEDIYTFDVSQPSAVTLTVTPDTATSDLSVSVRRACERIDSEVSCSNATTEGDEVLTTLLDPGTYYAIVQAADGASDAAYSINLTMSQATCSPGSSYCSDADTAMECDAQGSTLSERQCAQGCSPRTGTCNRVPGDRCVDPISQSSSFSATITWADFRNDYTVAAGGCVPGTDTQTDGADAVYAVQVPAGSAMSATLTFADGEQGALYVFSDCLQPGSSCIAGANADSGTDETVTWSNDTGADATVYLVADSSAASTMTSAGLEVSIDPVICTGGDTQCSGDDLQTCNALGTAFDLTQTCTFGCTSGACNPPPNQTCGGAIALTSGQPVTGTIDEYADSHKFAPSNTSCMGDAAAGPEAAYVVTTTQADQVVDVTLDAPYDAVLYATRSCLQDDLRCFAGVDDTTSGSEHLSFVAPEPGDYYIYADSTSSSASGTFTITATVTTPSCTPGEVTGCSGTDVQYCDATGTQQTYTCPNGDSCTNGACPQPSGDVCADPIVLHDGDTLTDSLSGTNSLELPAGRSGRCATDGGDATDGTENIYRVDLNAGDLLTVDFTTQSSYTHAFIAEDCVAPAATCMQQTQTGADGTLQYYADAARSVFVIVDSTSSSDTGQYTVSASITQGSACAPGQGRCTGADTLEVCNRDGSAYLASTTCSAGCADGACIADLGTGGSGTSDACTNAPHIGGGLTVYGDFGALTNDVEVSSKTCTGTSSSTSGGDLVYAVDVQANDVVTARIISQGGESPVVYILDGCSDPAASCQAGAYGSSSADYTAEAHYLADAAKTVYVVADSTSSSNDESFSLQIDVSPADCTTQGQTSCVDSTTEQVCDQGLWVSQACYYGTCSGSCPAPTNDACVDATSVPNDGQLHTYHGLLSDFTDQMDYNGASCAPYSFSHSSGPDAVYSVTANAGDIIQADWTAPYAVLWITTDCGNATSTCVDSDHVYSSGTASLTYKASSAGTYYIVADSDPYSSTDLSKPYTLDVQVRAPECSLGQTQCADANTLQTCDPLGLWADQTCAFGCNAGMCNAPPNDTCSTSTVVPADGTAHVYTAPIDAYTNSAALNAACGSVGATTSDGPDALYAVDLNQGDVLQVSWDGSYDSLWVANDCADINNACVAGSNGGNPESLTYVAPATGRYYVVGDSTSSSASGDSTMTIQAGPPECDPSVDAPQCAADGVTLQYCGTYGFWHDYTCQSSCSAGACSPHSGQVCADAIPLGNGDSDVQSFSGVRAIDIGGGTVGSCDFGTSDQPTGPDHIYAIDLLANQTLTVTYQTGINASGSSFGEMYLLNSCGDANSCLVNASGAYSGSTTMTYQAPQNGTVYLVVARSLSTSDPSYDYQIDISIQ